MTSHKSHASNNSNHSMCSIRERPEPTNLSSNMTMEARLISIESRLISIESRLIRAEHNDRKVNKKSAQPLISCFGRYQSK